MATRAEYNARPQRESLAKRLGRTARRIAARDGHRRVYCRATAASSGAPLQLDHLVPKKAGGADDPTNLVVACRPCNAARHDTPLPAWCRRVGLDGRTVRGFARRALPEAA